MGTGVASPLSSPETYVETEILRIASLPQDDKVTRLISVLTIQQRTQTPSDILKNTQALDRLVPVR